MNRKSRSDLDLMAQIRERDEEAFETLFGRHRETVRRYMAGIVRDQEAANDLVQEVFLRVWAHIEQWSGSGSVKA